MIIKILIIFGLFSLKTVWGVPLCGTVDLYQQNNLNFKNLTTMVYLFGKDCDFCQEQLDMIENQERIFKKNGFPVQAIVALEEGHPRPETRLPVDEGRLWNLLGPGAGHILVFDKCDRLSIHINMPIAWRVYKYAKASVLATIFDKPCGQSCDLPPQEAEVVREPEVQMTTYPEYAESAREGVLGLPLRITIREHHKHRGSGNTVFRYIVKDPMNPSFHGHLKEETEPTESPRRFSPRLELTTSHLDSPRLPYEDPESHPTPETSAPGVVPDQQGLVQPDPTPDQSLQNPVHSSDQQRKSRTDTTEFKRLQKHYSVVLKWLDYHF